MDDLTALAVAARDGDRVSLAAFVRRTQPDVWRLQAHLVGRDSADDLTQETYLRALPALDRYRADAPAKPWLLSIARRVAADAIRRAQRRRTLAGRLAGVAGRRPAAEPDPSAAATIDALVAGLDPDRRAAFVLTQLLGLTYAETALVCGCEIGTVRSRVARARAQLVAALAAGRAAEG